jgi:hypothetical protein
MPEVSKDGFPLVLVGIGLGALYWFVESLLNLFLTDNLNFFQQLLAPDLADVYRRLIVLCLLVMLGSHCQTKLRAYKEESQEWMAYCQHLEEGGEPARPE